MVQQSKNRGYSPSTVRNSPHNRLITEPAAAGDDGSVLVNGYGLVKISPAVDSAHIRDRSPDDTSD